MKELPIQFPTIFPVTSHTDYVGKGSTFVAINGSKLDGLNYIQLALEKGANKIVVQKNIEIPSELIEKIKSFNAEIVFVDDCRKAVTQLSAQAWSNPAKKLNILGITGTKGKTTSTFLLRHLLTSAGYKTAMISGVKNSIGKSEFPTHLTTPLSDYLQTFLGKCVEEKTQFVALESSAQAFNLHRLDGIEYCGVIFTNFDLEHSEFYESIEQYFESKCLIFNHLKNNAPVLINIDNEWGQKIIKLHPNFLTYSLIGNKATYSFKITKNNSSGISLKLSENIFVIPNLIGTFNAYNIAGVIALAIEIGIDLKVITDALLSFKGVPGRMEVYPLSNKAIAIIDKAHNPSSFMAVLPTLKNISDQLIVVFGAGGDRDKKKRPIMGEIAANIADKVIVTSDNPRTENVVDITNQVLAGIDQKYREKVICQLDRAKAIEEAYKLSKKGSIIAILGKGADEYEIIGDKEIFFSDKETILKCSSI